MRPSTRYLAAFALAWSASAASAETLVETRGCGLAKTCWTWTKAQTLSTMIVKDFTLTTSGSAAPASVLVTYRGALRCSGSPGNSIDFALYLGQSTLPPRTDGTLRGTSIVPIRLPTVSVQPVTLSAVVSINSSNRVRIIASVLGIQVAGSLTDVTCQFHGGFFTFQSPRDIVSGLPTN